MTGKFRCDGAENKREKIQFKEILHYDTILLTFCVVVGYYIFRKLRHKWEINIKMIVTELRCEVVVWFQLDLDRFQLWAFVNTIMNFWIL